VTSSTPTEEPGGQQRWTVDDIRVFMARSIAEVEAAIRESPQAGSALLGERATMVVTLLTGAAEGAARFIQEMVDQDAAPEEIEAARRDLDRIMAAAGGILGVAMRNAKATDSSPDT
jgi:hypothetical protein